MGGQVYTTIYAHLAQSLVSVGQKVKAGQLIAKADNTGNSFGSHLHLTLEIDGAQTPGFPPGIVDPWPYMREVAKDLPPASDLIVYASDILSLRSGPTTDSDRLTTLNQGDALTVLGDPDSAIAKIGKQDQWLNVRAPR